jgi:D-alanine--poly(phosphoribitol) ligase subunit 1
MKNSSFIILEKLAESLQNFSDRTAFYIQGVSYTYRQFQQRISAIQNLIQLKVPEEVKYIGIFSHDHPDTYASIFAMWCCGKAFVPLNPLNPAERNLEIIRQMGLQHILSAGESTGLHAGSVQMVLNTKNLLDCDSGIRITDVPPETDAYVLFTSGSTGSPKGVRINRRNLDAFYRSYIDFGPEYTSEDRFLQIYDISFDGSVPCYLVALCAGAAVYTVPQDEIRYLYAYKLMSDHALTVLKMTPSTLYYFRPFFGRINLPMVRACLFGGEALPLALVEEWVKCVPNALIQNVYGPTEATIDSLIYNFNSGDFRNKASGGIVSLGKNFGDFEYAVINSSDIPVEGNEPGELCLHGAQVMCSYWNDEERTTEAFIYLESSNGPKKFYRTGDLVFKDTDGFFMYCGRLDNQVQIQGYRVELGEIEKHSKDFVGEKNLAAVEAHNNNGNPEIVLFIGGDEQAQEPILSYLQSRLPQYMLPSKIIFMEELPRLVSGKTDRKTLSEKAKLHENN